MPTNIEDLARETQYDDHAINHNEMRVTLTKKVLFVCVENARRSQMAEAFFNRLAQGKVVAISARTKPSKEVNLNAIEIMREIGIDISKQKPKLLTQEMINKTNRTVTMGCGAEVCPAPFVKAEEWDIEDPQENPLKNSEKLGMKL